MSLLLNEHKNTISEYHEIRVKNLKNWFKNVSTFSTKIEKETIESIFNKLNDLLSIFERNEFYNLNNIENEILLIENEIRGYYNNLSD